MLDWPIKHWKLDGCVFMLKHCAHEKPEANLKEILGCVRTNLGTLSMVFVFNQLLINN